MLQYIDSTAALRSIGANARECLGDLKSSISGPAGAFTGGEDGNTVDI